MKNIKITLFFVLLSVILNSCADYRRIGSVTVISTRNIDPQFNYSELARNVEGISSMSNDDALQEAIDKAVKSIPGGEYMINTAIYQLKDKKIKVVGDVYGNIDLYQKSVADSQQFKKGQLVQWIDDKNRKVKAEIVQQNGENITIRLVHNNKTIDTTTARIIKLAS